MVSAGGIWKRIDLRIQCRWTKLGPFGITDVQSMRLVPWDRTLAEGMKYQEILRMLDVGLAEFVAEEK